MNATAVAERPPRTRRHYSDKTPAMRADLMAWGEYAHRERLWAGAGTTRTAARKRRPGRPSRLTPEVAERFLFAVRSGNYRSVAARLAGISPATLYRWQRDSRPPFTAFWAAVDLAEAQCEAEVVANLVNLSRVDTAAAAFWLRRRHPERWGATEPDGRRKGSHGYRGGSERQL